MGLMSKLFNNTRKPEGFLGKMMVSSMNSGHAKLAAWGMEHLQGLQPGRIGDFGCGGGSNASKLLQTYPHATVTALDYSPVSVAKTEKVNRKEIAAGRCTVVQGDVSALPFEDCSFDLVTAFETIYFWPGPEESFREVYRVLAPGGAFLITNECDGFNPADDKWVNTIEGMRIYKPRELMALLKAVGFKDISADHDEAVHRVCVLARK